LNNINFALFLNTAPALVHTLHTVDCGLESALHSALCLLLLLARRTNRLTLSDTQTDRQTDRRQQIATVLHTETLAPLLSVSLWAEYLGILNAYQVALSATIGRVFRHSDHVGGTEREREREKATELSWPVVWI